jgi:pimeloyl-ACP methyl ester carboxylesterase
MLRRALCLTVLLLVALPGVAAAKPSIAAAPLQTIKTGHGQVGYRSAGTGRPLVLIMGLSGTADSWDPAFVDALAARRRVITFDNMGIRYTSLGRTLTIASMADQTAALIRALHLRRPDVMGWSMGGMIAQSLAVRQPRLVRRLVLAATAPGDGKATFPSADALDVLLHPDQHAADLTKLLFAGPDADAQMTAWIARIGAYPHAVPVAPAAITSRQTGACATWLLGSDPAGKRVARLRRPVLIGGGDQDTLLPFANDRHLAKVIRGAKLVHYADSAHGFFAQHPAEFAATVNRFLKK